MKFTSSKINAYLFLKLPAAFITGVRLDSISSNSAVARVTYRWINQNPFKSMFWAVQGMASELSTGILVMKCIDESNLKISMLVTNMKGSFTKKAIGKIYFECNDGLKIQEVIKKAIETKEGQTVVLTSIGKNEDGVVVSQFEYEWSLKIKKSK